MAEEITDPFAGIVDTDTEAVVEAPVIEDVVAQETKPKEEEEDLSIVDYAMDFGAGVGRGALGFGQSVLDLVDTVAFDAIPDWDLREIAGVDEQSKTWVGTLAQGLTQFTLGFIPGGAAIKGLAAVNKFNKFGKLVTTVKAGSKVKLNGKGIWMAGATSDFISFGGQEERLSNFIQEFPALQNPVSEYLAADPDDGEIEGRFKNVIEGMFMEFGITIPLIKAFQKSISAIRKSRLEVPAGNVDGFIDDTVKSIDIDAKEAELLTKQSIDEIKVDDIKVEGRELAKVEAEPKKAPTPEEVTKIRVDKENLSKNIEDIIDADGIAIGSGGVVRKPVMNTTKEMDAILDTTTDVVIKNAKRNGKVTNAQLIEYADDLLNKMGHRSDASNVKLTKEVLALGDKALKETADATIANVAVRLSQQRLSPFLVDALNNVHNLSSLDVDDAVKPLAEFNSLLKQYVDLAGKNSEVNSAAGRFLASAKIGLDKKINIDPDVATKGELIKFTQDGDSLMNPEDLKALATIMKLKEEDMILNPELFHQLLDVAVQKKNLGDGIYSFWINSILSGVKTNANNLNSGMINTTLNASFIMGGGIIGGNPEMSKAMLAFGFKNLNLMRSLSMLKEGIRTGVSPFEGVGARSSISDGLPNRITNVTRDNAAGWLWENVVKFPTKFLSATDAVMKEVNFRISSQTKIAYEAMTSGITDPVQIGKMVEERMGKVLTEGGSINNAYNVRKETIKRLKKSGEWDNMKQSERAAVAQADEDAALASLKGESALQKHGMDYADQITYTNDLTGNLAKLQEGLQKIPGSRWVVPFIRTPINVISRSIDIATFAPRAIAGKLLPKTAKLEGIRAKLLSDLNHSDPFIKAQAQGKLAFSGAALFSIGAIVNADQSMITGSGPQDPAERKVMEAAGWQKYSIKIGDKYFSYQKFDPLASFIGMMADMRDVGLDPATVDNGFIENGFTAAMAAMTNNVLDKSFLTGLDSFLGAIKDEDKMKKWIGNTAASFIPSVLPQTAEVLTGSPATVEVWGIMDAMSRRAVFTEGGLDPKRNILGEEVKAQELSGVMDRMFDIVANVSNVADDIVLEEIAMLRDGFDIPSKTVGGGINLVEFEDPETGRTAYDTYRKAHGTVKLRGRTLRQELTRTIKMKWYQKLDARSLPDFRSARVEALQKVIRRYRAEALQETLDKFPELDNLYNEGNSLRAKQRAGGDVYSQVEALINLR